MVVDSAADSKMREQEYITVNGALGVIKKGQRIVDRGEIITPQVFTNLNTYQETVSQQSGDKEKRTFFTIGQGLYILIILSVLFIYLRSYRSTFYDDLRKMTFLTTFITLFEVFAVVMFEYFHNGFYLVPFAALPVIIMVFFDSRTAIFSLLSVVLVSAAVATFQFEFIFYELMAGITATLSIRQLSKRSQLLRTGLITFLVYTVCYLAVCLINEGDLQNFQWRIVGVFGVNSIALSFAYILIVVIEKTFGFTSTVTLVENSATSTTGSCGVRRRSPRHVPALDAGVHPRGRGGTRHRRQHAARAHRRALPRHRKARKPHILHREPARHKPARRTRPGHERTQNHIPHPRRASARTEGEASAGDTRLHSRAPRARDHTVFLQHGRQRQPRQGNRQVAVHIPGAEPTLQRDRHTDDGRLGRSGFTKPERLFPGLDRRAVERIISSQEADGLYKDSPISFKDIETVKATFKKRLATIYHGRVAYPEPP